MKDKDLTRYYFWLSVSLAGAVTILALVK